MRNSQLSIGVLLSALTVAFVVQAAPASEQQAFYNALKQLCGARYVGETVFPEEPGEDWRDQQLVATFETCTDDEIRIPLLVGANRSRTWVITPAEKGLQLKHDHRHPDGTPDEVTQYGGTTDSPGTSLAQSFPADAYTAELIPEAATNEWFLSLSPDLTTMTYYLERHGAPRFKAILHRDD